MEDSYWRGFWVGTASGTAAGLFILLITWLVTQLYKHLSQRNLNKVERLEAQLKQHRRGRRNLGAVALLELSYFIFQVMLGVGITSLMSVIVLTEGLVLVTSETAKDATRFNHSIFILVAALSTWILVLTLGSMRRILMFLDFADWKENRLIKRIKRLEPDWKDGEP